jgi:hypothetical protein
VNGKTEKKKPYIIQTKPPQEGKSFQVWVYVEHEWVQNGLRFATEQEATRYADDLSARWTAVESYDIQPSTDEPNAQVIRYGKHEKALDNVPPEGSA